MLGGGVGVYVQILCCDLALWGTLWGWVYLLGSPSDGGLAWLWALGILRWAFLHMASIASSGGMVVRRWVATQCLLWPIFRSSQVMLQPGALSYPIPGPAGVALITVSGIAACLFWELTFPEAQTADSVKEKKKQEAKALFLRVVRYSRPDILHLGTAFLFLSLAVICETFIPYATGKVIDILGSQYEQSKFLSAIGLMSILSLGSAVCSGVRGGMFMCSLARLNRRMRHMLFRNLVQQEIGFFEETKPGDLASRLESDTNLMGMSVAMNVNVLLRSTVKTAGMLVLMVGISWQLTLLTCVEMPLLAALQNCYNTFYQALSQQLQDCKAQAKELAGSAVGQVRTVRGCGAESAEIRRYEETLSEMHRIQSSKGIASAIHLLLRRVGMLFYGRQLIMLNHLTNGGLLAFVLYQKDMVTNMKSLVYVFGTMLNSVGAAAKVFKYLDRKPLQEEAGSLEPAHLEGRVEFRDVTFSYPSQPDKPALKGVSLTLRPGKVTALVGPSGGGKSSCISLLERFYESQQGEVLLDGRPLHQYQHSYLHRKVSIVSQNPVLFSGSVSDNIRYGLKDCSMERVVVAAVKAHAHDFICKLEDGYDTDVGECGGQLSVGQKQCIAIARALVRDPRVLILDEATSCMDAGTLQAMQELLSGTASQTVLVVAHHLQTVQNADHIVFLEGGVVVEQGTDKELMARRGRYRRPLLDSDSRLSDGKISTFLLVY
uniref:Transporter associated with antigen processing, subunit type t, teleost specific n=1 Tax=Scleropages formosus TaxID=113540 RepID=A0A8C9W6E8_SCLFO